MGEAFADGVNAGGRLPANASPLRALSSACYIQFAPGLTLPAHAPKSLTAQLDYPKIALMRRTKIVCTIGPATSSPAMIEKLIKAGMNVARLNFSHGSYAEHLEKIERIRDASAKLGTCVGILQDLCGPKIRIGKIEKGPVKLEQGQDFLFTSL